MEIKRSGSQPSGKGPAEYFAGTVRIDPLFQANDPARAFGASVTFEPGARTAWHAHPLGQTLIVTAGCGLAHVALAWMLSKPVITAPIIGATKPQHLDDAVAAVSVQLTPDEIRLLEEAYQSRPVLGHP